MKVSKRNLLYVLLVCFALSTVFSLTVAAENSNGNTERETIKLFINGEEVESDVLPFRQNGRVVVPVRVIVENFDEDIVWNAERNAVLINSLPSQAGAKESAIKLIVNGIKINPDVDPFLYNERTMVPIRWVSEALGLNVHWDAENLSVYVREREYEEPSRELYGWASVDANGINGTTGGGDAEPQVVTSPAEFRNLVGDDEPRVIIVSGHINSGSNAFRVNSNKTIIGEDKYATIEGGIEIVDSHNVIIRNLNFQGVWPDAGSPPDTLAARNSHHLWFDQLTLWDAPDGLLDLTRIVDYVTVSWSKFFYTSDEHDHRLASLNSSGTEHIVERGHNTVTYHNNWWANYVDQRMPRILFGRGHSYNNYFTSEDNSYAIGVGAYAAKLIENNYFENTNNPHQFMYRDSFPAHITARGNIYDNTTGNADNGENRPGPYLPVEPFDDPPYEYVLYDAEDVPSIVRKFSGAK